MLTKEQYEAILPYKPIVDMFVQTETYVGGADGLFDYLETQGLTGGEPILRTCNPCRAGFLKFTKSLLNNYEKTITT
jgi:hypothetical protein